MDVNSPPGIVYVAHPPVRPGANGAAAASHTIIASPRRRTGFESRVADPGRSAHPFARPHSTRGCGTHAPAVRAGTATHRTTAIRHGTMACRSTPIRCRTMRDRPIHGRSRRSTVCPTGVSGRPCRRPGGRRFGSRRRGRFLFAGCAGQSASAQHREADGENCCCGTALSRPMKQMHSRSILFPFQARAPFRIRERSIERR